MKRLFILFSALCVSLMAMAQTSGREVVGEVSKALSALGDYRIDFEVEMPSAEATSKGYCLVSDPRYIISIDGMMQGHDGEKMWMVDAIAREIVYDNHKAQSRNLFENPTRAFDFSEELFKVADFSDDGKGGWMVTLEPSQGVLEGIEYVVLWVSKKTMLPTKLGYDMSGVGIYINILKVAAAESSVADFSVNTADYPDYEVIDFR